ncbi:hypothetical protein AXG93_4804s1080 [Marchantia polymorpha subsp. ruderalis]|uniref:Uncharacterized protein n=2 Tax=Marchantia polymorpha TaxID=3197 RepID=A0A176VNN4_MARPO|nr:hypothetical protein AXG93_4804s1080 [Marchantia polymorpha subsp. ruderalis]
MARKSLYMLIVITILQLSSGQARARARCLHIQMKKSAWEISEQDGISKFQPERDVEEMQTKQSKLQEELVTRNLFLTSPNEFLSDDQTQTSAQLDASQILSLPSPTGMYDYPGSNPSPELVNPPESTG